MGFALSDIQLTSSAFVGGGAIPSKHTGEGEDVSPSLAWMNSPDGTEAFAVVCHDPDAPLITPVQYGFVHWVLYNIPGNVAELAEGTDQHTQGQSDFGKSGYGGPMPPEGHGLHQYYFWVLALNSSAEHPAGLSMLDLFATIEPSVIGMNRLVGTYQRG
ncbi:MAG: YbhB/YbcL family Raf kinase inhibitor-like protein [Gammaproteobacteria bacterium]|nr:YbhB/YbcL family Raf kinase inhibitor-like protein [Gammaproteobacteria bacterium]